MSCITRITSSFRIRAAWFNIHDEYNTRTRHARLSSASSLLSLTSLCGLPLLCFFFLVETDSSLFPSLDTLSPVKRRAMLYNHGNQAANVPSNKTHGVGRDQCYETRPLPKTLIEREKKKKKKKTKNKQHSRYAEGRGVSSS